MLHFHSHYANRADPLSAALSIKHQENLSGALLSLSFIALQREKLHTQKKKKTILPLSSNHGLRDHERAEGPWRFVFEVAALEDLG